MAVPESKRNFSAVQLTPGKSYRVIADFKDYDGRSHLVGETWTYTSHEFLPYEDGLTCASCRMRQTNTSASNGGKKPRGTSS